MSSGPTFYALRGKLAVPVSSMEDWAKEFDWDTRHVASTRIGGIWISTVFVGIDMRYGDGPPLLFETMAFRGGEGDDCERSSTWEEAEAQHKAMVAKVRAEIKDKANI